MPLPPPEQLTGPAVGVTIVRGGSLRLAGYGLGMLLTAAGAVLLLRHFGPADFGRYMAIASLVAIVSGLTDAGLTAVAVRDLSVCAREDARLRFQANVLGLRLALTAIGVVVAVGFAILAGYGRSLALGTALAGTGLLLTVWQSTMTLPLSMNLQLGRLTIADAIRQAATLAGIAALVGVGARLLPFFAVPIAVGAIMLVVTPILAGRGVVWRPALHSGELKALMREALPLAASVVMGVLYFRLLIVLMSLVASAVATGLFATSFRIVEILYGISALAVTTALPVLAVAAADRGRLVYIVQRMTEAAAIASVYLALLVVVLARPVVLLLAGDRYGGAVTVLQIQSAALVPVFIGQVLQTALISIRRQSVLVATNAFALAVVLTLGLVLSPIYGAKGAALAAVSAEVALALALAVGLARSDRSLTPKPWTLWKVCVAAAAGAATAFLTGLPRPVAAVLFTVVYLLVLIVTRGLPGEVIDAFGLRRVLGPHSGRLNQKSPHP